MAQNGLLVTMPVSKNTLQLETLGLRGHMDYIECRSRFFIFGRAVYWGDNTVASILK